MNQLGAATSAVTVTVVLNIRKLASFLLSCWIFGNHVNELMVWAAGVVFVSGAVYGLGGALGKRGVKKAAAHSLETEAETGKDMGTGKDGNAGDVLVEGVQGVNDSLAIAKGYATSGRDASPGLRTGPHTSATTAATGKSCSSSRTPWREVRDSVHGMMRDAGTHVVAAMAELDGTPAVVHTDGSMSPRGMWPRRESVQSTQSLTPSPEVCKGRGRGVEGDSAGEGWATGLSARLNSDGSMTRR